MKIGPIHEALVVDALRLAAEQYIRDSCEAGLPERIRSQFERQAREAISLADRIDAEGLER